MNEDLNLLFSQIRQWAAARNLIDGSTPHAQTVKLMEEAGELAAAVARNQSDALSDAIGDCVVVLTILAAQKDVRIEDCIALAYDQIRHRTGKMINGVFVKDAEC